MKKIILIIALFLSAQISNSQVAGNNAQGFGNTCGFAPCTPSVYTSASFTMNVGANGLLILSFSVGPLVVIQSVTYGGVAMTLRQNIELSSTEFYVYTLANPPTGANTFVIDTDTLNSEMESSSLYKC